MIDGDPTTRVGLIAYGSSHPSMVEARDLLLEEGIATEYCRLRALPHSDEVVRFIERHERVYFIEQNRDGQVASLMRASLRGDLADRLVSITHYNGTPLAAENIVRPIVGRENSPDGAGHPGSNGEAEGHAVPHSDELSNGMKREAAVRGQATALAVRI